MNKFNMMWQFSYHTPYQPLYKYWRRNLKLSFYHINDYSIFLNSKDGHIIADKIHFRLISWQVIAYRLHVVYMFLLLQMGSEILRRTLQMTVDRLNNTKPG